MDTMIQEKIIKIYERSITPFEKINKDFIHYKLSNNEYALIFNQWKKNIAPKGDEKKIKKYFNLLRLDKDMVEKMLSPIKVKSCCVFPDWVLFFNTIQFNNPTYTFSNTDIPFLHLLNPFTSQLKEYIVNDKSYSFLSKSLLDNLKTALLKQLSHISQNVFQKEFEIFKAQSLLESSIDNRIYKSFVSDNLSDNLIIFLKYPLLARLLGETSLTFMKNISTVITNFINDIEELETFFGVSFKSEKIIDIHSNIADQHNGESTLILEFESSYKLVYKPGSSEISNGYNMVIDWVNSETCINLKKFQILNKEKYGWLEFVTKSECKNETEIKNYYKRAGILLGITYFLNSSDYHYENLIASGEFPVLIDHETIIQPKVKNKYNILKNEEIKTYEDSVLKASLLPSFVSNIGIPSSSMCGFGSSKNNSINGWVENIAFSNTDKSKKVIQQKRIHFDKLNIPIFKGEKRFLFNYQDSLKEGFTIIYNLFYKSKKELFSKNSPINYFKNVEIRYVWRPTNTYVKIKKMLYKPEFLSDSTKYGLYIELLSRAYLNKAEYSNFFSLLNDERMQFLNGDIPIFKISSNSTNIIENQKTQLNLFSFDAYSNIKRKIQKACNSDYNIQLNLINQCLNNKYYL